MARLTLPRLHKETGALVKFSGKLTDTRTYLREVSSNPRGGDLEISMKLKAADAKVEEAKAALSEAVKNMADVAKTLERRKAPSTK